MSGIGGAGAIAVRPSYRAIEQERPDLKPGELGDPGRAQQLQDRIAELDAEYDRIDDAHVGPGDKMRMMNPWFLAFPAGAGIGALIGKLGAVPGVGVGNGAFAGFMVGAATTLAATAYIGLKYDDGNEPGGPEIDAIFKERRELKTELLEDHGMYPRY